MADLVRELLDAVAPRDVRDVPELPWAIVSQATPLEVTFPGDSAGVPVSPARSYSAPAVGDRVVVARVGRALVALGAL